MASALSEEQVQSLTTTLQAATKLYKSLPNDGFTRFHSLRTQLDSPIVRFVQQSLVDPSINISSTGDAAPRRFPLLHQSIELVEHMAYIDASIALVLAGSTLGSTPVLATGNLEMIGYVMESFRRPGVDIPLVSLALSEPGGTANFMEAGGNGLRTVATPAGENWIVNGEKIWSTSIGGWQMTGPDFICLACRDGSIDHRGTERPADSFLLLLVPKKLLNSENFSIIAWPMTPGLTATSGPHVRFTNLRVPNTAQYVISKGSQAAGSLVETSQRGAVVAAAMSLGMMRRAIDEAFDFATTEDRGAAHGRKVINNDNAAALVARMRARYATSRSMTEMAARALDEGSTTGREMALQAKVYSSEEGIQCVLEASRLIGVTSYDHGASIIPDLLLDAMGIPLIGGSNEMIRKTLAAIRVG